MAWDLRLVDLDFFGQASHSWTSTGLVSAPIERVFAAISEDPAGWGTWFPGFSSTGRYLDAPPHGVGSTREVSMGGIRYRETVLAWDQPTRWAFRVDRAGLPLVSALCEDYQLEPVGSGTRLSWTLATEPRAALRPLAAGMGPVLARLCARAAANLSRRLAV
ncbi:MAG: SRPBCC family protein [Acidimicrobiales bacterium]